jgi:hypothetical protein
MATSNESFVEVPTEFYYITISTRPHHILDKLKEKVEKNGETIIVLGEKERRFIGWEGSQNFGLKLKEVSIFINRTMLNDNDIVLFTDAYDVAYFGNREEVISRFREFNKPIVFGCERYCNPDPNLSVNYKDIYHEFCYLNSGMFIGYVWALRKCISEYVYEDRDDDQRYWTNQFLNVNPELFALDYLNRLFLNTVDIDMSKFTVSEGIARYKGRCPMFVHVNGPDKRLIDEICN